jgi:hypothetical protein
VSVSALSKCLCAMCSSSLWCVYAGDSPCVCVCVCVAHRCLYLLCVLVEEAIEAKVVVLTQEEYMQKTHNDSSVYHFYEKLLRLRHMMKTDTGRQMAEKRHQYMVGFLKQFFLEYQGLV